MKRIAWMVALTLSVVGLLGITSREASAQISVVVSAASSAKATLAQVTDMYLGASTTWPSGAKVQLIDQPESDVGKQFYAKVVKRPVTIVSAQLTKLALSGQGLAPRRVADDAAVKEAVKKSPGCVGYIATSSLDASVKELFRVE